MLQKTLKKWQKKYRKKVKFTKTVIPQKTQKEN